jgi:hypothetical protein
VVSLLLAMPLIAELAMAADARSAGGGAPAGRVIAAGGVVAVLYPLAGVVVLGRPTVAAALFLLAAAVGFAFGRDDGWDGLTSYGVLALMLAAASARTRLALPTSLVDRRGDEGR